MRCTRPNEEEKRCEDHAVAVAVVLFTASPYIIQAAASSPVEAALTSTETALVRVTIPVVGMDCVSCGVAIQRGMDNVEAPYQDFELDLEAGTVSFGFVGEPDTADAFAASIRDIGYEVGQPVLGSESSVPPDLKELLLAAATTALLGCGDPEPAELVPERLPVVADPPQPATTTEPEPVRAMQPDSPPTMEPEVAGMEPEAARSAAASEMARRSRALMAATHMTDTQMAAEMSAEVAATEVTAMTNTEMAEAVEVESTMDGACGATGCGRPGMD